MLAVSDFAYSRDALLGCRILLLLKASCLDHWINGIFAIRYFDVFDLLYEHMDHVVTTFHLSNHRLFRGTALACILCWPLLAIYLRLINHLGFIGHSFARDPHYIQVHPLTFSPC
jgi:hypothetical protein